MSETVNCFSYCRVHQCSQWHVTSHSALEVCHWKTSGNSPGLKGGWAPVPHKRAHLSTAEDSEHCRSETETHLGPFMESFVISKCLFLSHICSKECKL